MTAKPIWVTRETSLDDALKLMDAGDIRHVPVLQDGELIGVLSDRDLLESVGWLPARVHACRGPQLSDPVPRLVGDILLGPAMQIGPQNSVAVASERMLRLKIGCLPIVESGSLLGILTEMDLLQAFASECHASKLPEGSDPSVSDSMTRNPVTVEGSASLLDAAAICYMRGIRHIPVLAADQLVGVLSDRDLRRAAGVGRHDDTSVDQIMTRDPVTVAPDARLSRAAEVMRQGKFSGLPVLDGEELVGILNLADVLEHSRKALG